MQHVASLPALAIDAAVIVALSIASGALFQSLSHGAAGDIQTFAATGAIVSVLFCGLVRWQAPRDVRASATRLGRVRMAATAWITTFLFLIVLAFGMKISAQFSRGAIFSFFLAGFAGVSISRAATPRILARWLDGSAYRGMEVLIVAPHTAKGLTQLRAELARQGCRSIRTIGFDDGYSSLSWPLERRRLLQDVFDAARSAAHGGIYVMAGQLPFEVAAALMAGLRLIPRAVYFVPDEQVSALLQNTVHGLGSVVALEMQKTPMSRSERALKRVLDIAIACAALFFISPLLAAIAIAVKSDSRGPLLFRQTRLGYRGHPFQILKFRSMTVLEDGDEIKQASRGDQRITRVGKWLRRSSLDELPQLWNVLRGEMAIVGPRPHAAAHDAHFAKLIENYEVRQHVKPGITGWAQVHGLRGETPVLDQMYRRIEADLWYASNCSLGLDVQILLKTVGAVLRQENAF
ncbi:MAG TPA: exopolysaccharide biosynthesis polyprenyl glycosylphosphotransferase [Rhizomicrobium sp.]|nr:exopolysaccharide biosynthesis polyprenyl glycosylphosphotransferase [Rhizomicrobium sp.]